MPVLNVYVHVLSKTRLNDMKLIQILLLFWQIYSTVEMHCLWTLVWQVDVLVVLQISTVHNQSCIVYTGLYTEYSEDVSYHTGLIYRIYWRCFILHRPYIYRIYWRCFILHRPYIYRIYWRCFILHRPYVPNILKMFYISQDLCTKYSEDVLYCTPLQVRLAVTLWLSDMRSVDSLGTANDFPWPSLEAHSPFWHTRETVLSNDQKNLRTHEIQFNMIFWACKCTIKMNMTDVSVLKMVVTL